MSSTRSKKAFLDAQGSATQVETIAPRTTGSEAPPSSTANAGNVTGSNQPNRPLESAFTAEEVSAETMTAPDGVAPEERRPLPPVDPGLEFMAISDHGSTTDLSDWLTMADGNAEVMRFLVNTDDLPVSERARHTDIEATKAHYASKARAVVDEVDVIFRRR